MYEDSQMTTKQYANIAAHLPEMAKLQPDTPALHVPTSFKGRGETEYCSYSFKELDQHSNRMAHALESVGIKRGVRTVLMVTPSLEFVALTFALYKVGAVPVMVDPGIGVKNLKVCLAEAQPEAFIGVPKAHIARLLFGWGKPTVKTLLTVGNKLFWGGTTLQQAAAPFPLEKPYSMLVPEKGETAAILFTSGSTGVPKGVVYSHENFAAQVDQLKKTYKIMPGEIDLPTFPLFALFAPALGMTSVLPVMDYTRPGSVDPENIIKPIQKFGCTSMFGSPALIKRVGEYGKEKGIKLPTLKRAISAGAPVQGKVLETFSSLLNDDTEIFTPYGATESLPACSIGSKEILSETRFDTDKGKGVCVGKPVSSIELKVIAIDDGEIENWSNDLLALPGQIGEIVVKGPQVTRKYFNRDASTRLAKIKETDGTFWHRMGDLGYLDDQGRVWFCGRKSHRVTTKDKTLLTIPCEGIFNSHEKVYRTALVGVGPAGKQKPFVCVELEKDVDPSEGIAVISDLKAMAQQHEETKLLKQFRIHPGFPVDIRHNAKIYREKLAVWVMDKQS